MSEKIELDLALESPGTIFSALATMLRDTIRGDHDTWAKEALAKGLALFDIIVEWADRDRQPGVIRAVSEPRADSVLEILTEVGRLRRGTLTLVWVMRGIQVTLGQLSDAAFRNSLTTDEMRRREFSTLAGKFSECSRRLARGTF